MFRIQPEITSGSEQVRPGGRQHTVAPIFYLWLEPSQEACYWCSTKLLRKRPFPDGSLEVKPLAAADAWRHLAHRRRPWTWRWNSATWLQPGREINRDVRRAIAGISQEVRVP